MTKDNAMKLFLVKRTGTIWNEDAENGISV